MKRTLLLPVLALTGLVSCIDSVEPGSTPPELNTRGKEAARQLVFLLKSLRIYHDVNEVAKRFAFEGLVMDTLVFAPPFWDQRELVSTYAAALGKSARTGGGLAADYASALTRGLGRSPQPPVFDSITIDSLLRLPVDSSGRLRFAYPAPGLLSPWTSGYDSVFARQGVGEKADIDSIRAFRVVDTGGVIVEDVNLWEGAGRIPRYRDQRHTKGGVIVYRHHALLRSRDIADLVWVVTDTSRWVIMAERQDTSDEWWEGSNALLLYSYTDSLYRDPTNFAVRTLVDSIGSGADGVVFSSRGLLPSDTIRVRGRFLSDRGGPAVSEVDFTQNYVADSGGYTLSSYRRTDRYADGDGASVDLKVDPAGPCSLLVSYVPAAANTRTTPLGAARFHRYSYAIEPDFGWDSVVVVSAARLDSFAAGEPAAVALWHFTPEPPLALSAVGDLGPGAWRVSAAFAAGDEVTRGQEWTFADTGTVAAYSYTWAGVGRDTIVLRGTRVGATFAYEYKHNWNTTRGGSVAIGDSLVSVADSLWMSRPRFFAATVSADGEEGALSAVGLDTAALEWRGDSIWVYAYGAAAVSVPDTFVWVRSARRFVAAFGDGQGGTYSHTYDIDGTGTITGFFDGPGSLAGVRVHVSPTYDGGAELAGVSTEDVSASLSIRLWGANTLGGEYTFY